MISQDTRATEYEFQEFPLWATGPDGEKKLVDTPEQFKLLGAGWEKPVRGFPEPFERSSDFQMYPRWVNGVIVADAEAEAALLASQPDSERAILLQIAAEKGIKVDGRWSDTKLRAAIEAA